MAIADISRQLGGAIAGEMNEWLANHAVAATADAALACTPVRRPAQPGD